MRAPEPISALPRLKATEVGPCAVCSRPLVHTGFPLFFRLSVQRAGLDGNAVRERLGLAPLLGTAEFLYASIACRDPAVVIDSSGPANICNDCAMRHSLLDIHALMLIGTDNAAD